MVWTIFVFLLTFAVLSGFAFVWVRSRERVKTLEMELEESQQQIIRDKKSMLSMISLLENKTTSLNDAYASLELVLDQDAPAKRELDPNQSALFPLT